ncbi:MAG: hypothetical protein EOM10_13190, partial [Opitutae bacterium]|nr:hypothetical protein [Opitutae bacterium]
FTDGDCIRVWRAAAILQHQGKPVDLISVAESMGGDSGDNMMALAELVEACPTTAYASRYVAQVAEGERRRKLSDAARLAADALAKGGAVDVVADTLKAATEAVGGGGGGHALAMEYPAFRFKQLQALDPKPEENHIVGKGWLRRGAWTLFTGGTGIGKSVAVEQIAACVACGKSIFGLSVARPFRVILLTAENDEETCKRDFEAIAAHEGLDPDLLDQNLQIHHAYALDGPELVAAVDAEIRRGGFDLLVMDNYQAFSGDDINGSKEWKTFIKPLVRLLKAHRAAMLLVDHTGKPAERKGWGRHDSVYIAAGTSRKANGARTSAELYSPADGDERYRLHFGKNWERAGVVGDEWRMVQDVYLDRAPDAHKPYWTPSEDQEPLAAGGGRRHSIELTDDEAVGLLGGVAYTTEQTRMKLRAAGESRDGATDHIRRLLADGKLVSWSPSVPHPPTYIGTAEAIEKIKATMAERAQGKLPLGGQTSQTSQTFRRKSGKSRRP